jgi:nitrite reductase/ring-hydroxylating ferredoxin subunit
MAWWRVVVGGAFPSPRPQADPRPDAGVQWTLVGAAHELAKDGRLRVVPSADVGPIMVVATRRGPVAFRDRCPHMGRTLADGELVRDRIRCRGHRWEFRLPYGKPVGAHRAPTLACGLTMLPVEVRDGDVFVAARHPSPATAWAPIGRVGP